MNRVGPTTFPGSDKPFNPINPWGRKAVAVGVDGQKLPADWKSPVAQPTYQVFVEDREKGVIAIGPSWGQPEAEQLLSSVKIAIKAGKVTSWANPHIVKKPPQRAVARIF